jgi:dihydrofolate reductase
MRRLVAFTNVSVDGYFAGPNGEIDWFKNSDEEDRQFMTGQASQSATLMFGRTTYEMMAGYWPTPGACRDNPVVAGVMNSVPKIVFSKTMKPVEDGPVWKNVRVFRGIVPDEIIALKKQAGGDLAILGSGTLVQQFASLGLIDEYGLLVNPVVLGSGKRLFSGVKKMNLQLLAIRTFRNGKVFLRYCPV